jgi:hypothetical protein
MIDSSQPPTASSADRRIRPIVPAKMIAFRRARLTMPTLKKYPKPT